MNPAPPVTSDNSSMSASSAQGQAKSRSVPWRCRDCLRGIKREDGEFGTDPEAEAPAEAHAGVHVEVTVAIRIQPRGPSACFFAQEQAAETRPVHLPAVRVTAENHVSPVHLEPFRSLRVVRQYDARRVRTRAAERGLRIGFSAPEIINSRDQQMRSAAFDPH